MICHIGLPGVVLAHLCSVWLRRISYRASVANIASKPTAYAPRPDMFDASCSRIIANQFASTALLTYRRADIVAWMKRILSVALSACIATLAFGQASMTQSWSNGTMTWVFYSPVELSMTAPNYTPYFSVSASCLGELSSASNAGNVGWVLTAVCPSSSNEPTATGSLAMAYDDTASASATNGVSPGTAESSATADLLNESASVEVGDVTNGPISVGATPVTVQGSSLTFTPTGGGSWEAVETNFISNSLSASCSTDSPSRLAAATATAKMNPEGTAGIISNSLVIVPH